MTAAKSITDLINFDVRADATRSPAPLVWLPAAERIVSGNPEQRAWVDYASADQRFSAGIWECDGGAWQVIYTEHEYCRMLAGRVRISDAAGGAREYVAGDSFVIPAGFTGQWEVLEAARKIFVIYETA